ncbi:MAG: hypothetical protein ACYDAN_05795 [Candidatus Limnocylindrales bacterium]
MGPDLLGAAGATAFLLGVISLFALVDRVLCGAWEALTGSPGRGLVAGMAAWGRDFEARSGASPSTSPSSGSPCPPDPVPVERVRGPGLVPGLRGGLRHEIAAGHA